jgi:F-type H+-transporting ATPase subunit alpha
MQLRIQRGRLLREILKQGRLDPLSIECQMAWLIAYNDGLLDALEAKALDAALRRLRAGATRGEIALDAGRDRWVEQVRGWLKASDDEPTT